MKDKSNFYRETQALKIQSPSCNEIQLMNTWCKQHQMKVFRQKKNTLSIKEKREIELDCIELFQQKLVAQTRIKPRTFQLFIYEMWAFF